MLNFLEVLMGILLELSDEIRMEYKRGVWSEARVLIFLGSFGFCFLDFKLSFLYLIWVRLGLDRWNQIAPFSSTWFGLGLGFSPYGHYLLNIVIGLVI